MSEISAMQRLVKILELSSEESFTQDGRTWTRVNNQIIVHRGNEFLCTKSIQNLEELYWRLTKT